VHGASRRRRWDREALWEPSQLPRRERFRNALRNSTHTVLKRPKLGGAPQPSGNRQLNRLLHVIALVQVRTHGTKVGSTMNESEPKGKRIRLDFVL